MKLKRPPASSPNVTDDFPGGSSPAPRGGAAHAGSDNDDIIFDFPFAQTFLGPSMDDDE